MEHLKNNQQLDSLLKVVGQKLGMPPEKLRQELEAGRFDRAIAGLKPQEAAAFQQVLADPQRLNKIMNSKQAKALYQKLTQQ